MTEYKIFPVGRIHNSEEGTIIELQNQYIPALKGLEGFSHIQVIWWFSHCDNEASRSTLQENQPYKNSPKVMGTFAMRTPLRPNPIALTTTEVLHIDEENGRLQIAYIDAANDSPVLDIKPYTPSLDRIESPKVPTWCSHWPKSSEESADFPWENEFNF